MATFRYGVAVAFVCTLLPVLLYWPLVHGLIGLWRRLGPPVACTVLWGGMAVMAGGLFLARESLVGADLGTHGAVLGAGGVCLVLAGWLRLRLHRVITNRLILGLPELAPETYPQPLVHTGLYARVRHPRYLQFLLAQLGWALIANHLGLYLVWLAWIPAVFLITVLEERELRRRFGADYERYCREVPRFLPRWRPGGRAL